MSASGLFFTLSKKEIAQDNLGKEKRNLKMLLISRKGLNDARKKIKKGSPNIRKEVLENTLRKDIKILDGQIKNKRNEIRRLRRLLVNLEIARKKKKDEMMTREVVKAFTTKKKFVQKSKKQKK